MIALDIPIGKAIMPVKAGEFTTCDDCALNETEYCSYFLLCSSGRRDKNNVVFKLIDVPEAGNETL